ncbi:MAG TPA: hypothetical protein VJT75_13850 [Thermoleophilaceae bacterium]|nr:hypothetical protein [Thermoleophilaceae bacterium]
MESTDADTRPIFTKPRPSVPRMFAAFAAAGAIAALGGYAIGHAGGKDLDAARTEGAREGLAAGGKVGRREGYRRGFARGKKAGYDASYDRTFVETYKRAGGRPSALAQQGGTGQ